MRPAARSASARQLLSTPPERASATGTVAALLRATLATTAARSAVAAWGEGAARGMFVLCRVDVRCGAGACTSAATAPVCTNCRAASPCRAPHGPHHPNSTPAVVNGAPRCGTPTSRKLAASRSGASGCQPRRNHSASRRRCQRSGRPSARSAAGVEAKATSRGVSPGRCSTTHHSGFSPKGSWPNTSAPVAASATA